MRSKVSMVVPSCNCRRNQRLRGTIFDPEDERDILYQNFRFSLKYMALKPTKPYFLK
jgi:hypothetical protein